MRLHANGAAAAALLIAASGIAGCNIVDAFSDRATQYNVETDQSNNQEILLNILRASDRRPIQITSMHSVSATGTATGTLGISAPLRQFGGHTPLTISPGLTLSGQPTFSVDVLDTQEFYQGFLAPIKLSLLDYYIHEGYPTPVLFHALLREVVVSQGTQRFTATNEIGDPGTYPDFKKGYRGFHKIINAFYDAALSTEAINEETNVGPPLKPEAAAAQLDKLASTATNGLTLVYVKDLTGLTPAERQEWMAAGMPNGGGYRLKKTSVGYRFCLQIRETTREDEALQGSRLLVVATGLRCGATKAERQAMEPTAMNAVAPPPNPQPAAPKPPKTGSGPGTDVTNASTIAAQIAVQGSETIGETKPTAGIPQPSQIQPFQIVALRTDCAKIFDKVSGRTDSLVASYCGFIKGVEKATGIEFKDEGLSFSIKLVTRSAEAMLYYLGELARRQTWNEAAGLTDVERVVCIPQALREGRTESESERQAIGRHCRKEDHVEPICDNEKYFCRPLLVINSGPEAPSRFVSVDYDGKEYSVPKGGTTAQIFELFHQLMALNKSGKDLPATTILTVTGVP